MRQVAQLDRAPPQVQCRRNPNNEALIARLQCESKRLNRENFEWRELDGKQIPKTNFSGLVRFPVRNLDITS